MRTWPVFVRLSPLGRPKLEREINLSNLVSFRYRVGAEQRVYHMVGKVDRLFEDPI